MFNAYPAAWLLLGLPFLSSMLVRSVPWLWRPAVTLQWFTRGLGVVGLACLFASLLGLVPPPFALPLAIAGGAVSGYVVFWPSGGGRGSDGEDWRRRKPPPDQPPPPPPDGAPIDWQTFDHMRAQWERRPVTSR